MSSAWSTPEATEAPPRPGDHVAVRHTCTTEFGTLDHDAPVTVTSLTQMSGDRVRVCGVRCDGSRIEWVHGDE